MAIPTNIKTLLSGDVVEWARIEFKETWDPVASLKSVCAFANDLDNWGGGYIVIGVEKSIYASFDDIVKFACQKYSLGEIHNYSMHTDYFGDCEINYEGNKYIVEESEVKQFERERITESVYCNEFKSCSLSWFYTSIGDELVPEDMAIVDDELIQKASALLGYESEKDMSNGLADVIENDANGEDKFIASLILAKEIAGLMNGRAILWYD